ncbi:MAG: chloride channel protein [Deferribacteraceae bacterium]|nr:chloride channel protein [Deferribacteraceae bacterium]
MFTIKQRFSSQYQNLYIVLVAVIIGVAVGLGNIAFRSAISLVQYLCYGTTEEAPLPYLQAAAIWKIVLFPTLGGLVVGLIYHFYKTTHRGVPSVMKSLLLQTPIPPLSGVMTIVTSAITLGSGGSAGREGPIVQIGAAFGAAVGRVFRFSAKRMRLAIASGAGGGLAATFNTPMAGAMFTAEVLLGRLSFQAFAPVVISCISATVISRAFFGNHVTFITPAYVLSSPIELLLYAALGIITGLVGAGFLKVYFATASRFAKLSVPSWLKPAIGGLFVGLIGIHCRNIMGVGYGTIMSILDESIIGWLLLGLVGLKILATSLTLGSGGAGGLFVPSLFIGASLGGFVGWGAQLAFPSIVLAPSSYAMVGMAAMLAATMRAPITAILMIFEITQSYQVVLPLMAAAILANVFASFIEKESFFTKPLAAEGFNIGHGTELALLEQVKVRDIMVADIVVFQESTPFHKILDDIRNRPHEYFPVVDVEGKLTGIISLKDIKMILFEDSLGDIVVAQDIGTREDIRSCTPQDTLAAALALMGEDGIGDLPVVDSSMKLVGLLRRADILTVYNKKILDLV